MRLNAPPYVLVECYTKSPAAAPLQTLNAAADHRQPPADSAIFAGVRPSPPRKSRAVRLPHREAPKLPADSPHID